MRVRGRVRRLGSRGDRRGCRRHRSGRSEGRHGGESSNVSDFGIVLGTGDVATVNDRTGQGIGMLFISGSN